MHKFLWTDDAKNSHSRALMVIRSSLLNSSLTLPFTVCHIVEDLIAKILMENKKRKGFKIVEHTL